MVLLLERRTLGHENIPGLLQSLCSLDISGFIKAALLILANLADHLIVEVLDQMEVVKDRLDMRAALFKSFLEVGVHIAGDSLHTVHPFQTDMVNEVVDDLFLLAIGDPEDVSGLHVDDVGGVLPAVVELEFINAEDLRSLLRLDKFLAVYGVQLLQPLLVDGFHCVLAQAGDLRHLLVSICSDGEEIPCVLVKLLCYAVTDGFEGDELALRRSAGRTFELVMWEEHAAQVTAEAQMPQYDIRVGVNVHTLPTLAHPVFFLDSQTAAKAEYRASGLRCFCCRFFIFEAVQKRRNPQMFLRLRLKKQLTVGLGAYILHLEEPPLGRSICPGRQYPILADGSSLFNSFARCLYRHPTEKVIDPEISKA